MLQSGRAGDKVLSAISAISLAYSLGFKGNSGVVRKAVEETKGTSFELC